MRESTEDLRAIKAKCLREMREALPYYEARLSKIDSRVLDYARDVLREDVDVHNLDEILCLRKFWRILDAYPYDYDRVHQVVTDAEGVWTADADGRWKHVSGGLKIDGIYGYGYYRQTPMQVYTYAWIYGPHIWKDTTSPIGSREMLPSEREGENGTIWDLRRLITNLILMWPRKVAKTFTGSFVQFEGLMRDERDYEGYIAAGSSDQSALLFNMTKSFLIQLDGWSKYFKITNSPQDRCISWKQHTGRKAFVRALTAGGKTKDGLKASCCSADEFGAAQRVQGKLADMESLVNVLKSSMGPRREPLTIHTSTAGMGLETPYEMLINAFHDELLGEMEVPLGDRFASYPSATPPKDPRPSPEGCTVATGYDAALSSQTSDDAQHLQPEKRRSGDSYGGIILRPDRWEMDDEAELRTERVIRKVNPNLGVTIQPDYYAREWEQAERDPSYKKEVITKLYNIFASDRAVDWITGDEIRPLQVDMKIEDCKATDGWVVLSGLDFTNVGDDLQALSMLAVRARRDGKGREFFADLRAWITEEAVMGSPIKNVLLDWASRGYLYIVKSKVLSPNMPVDEIAGLRSKGVNMMGFGYDPFRANEPINLIKDWIVGFGVKPSDLANYVMPVGQKFGNMTPLIDEMTYMIRCEQPMIRFSASPLWPWEFNNCQLVESTDGMENKKVVKTRPEMKVDNVQALLDALFVYDTMNGKVVK